LARVLALGWVMALELQQESAWVKELFPEPESALVWDWNWN
jgi:hypothetical protein